MALHRDIFWVGKQWAVTGYGMQAVDQKQKSKFDIEASRVWEDDLLDNLRDQRWFNAEDFNAGLSVARAKYPEAPAKAAARTKAKESARVPVAPSRPAPKAEAKVEPKTAAKAEALVEPPKPDVKAKATRSQPVTEPAKPAASAEVLKPQPAKPDAPAASKLAITSGSSKATINVDTKARRRVRPAAQFNMGAVRWPAKFTTMWRVRIKR
jgi:outer membrane biosynthesis protein TonB